AIEGGLLADDEVVPAPDGLAQHLHGVEKGRRDARDLCGRVAGFERVDGVWRWRGGVAMLDAQPGRVGGKSLCQCRRGTASRQSSEYEETTCCAKGTPGSV